MGPHAAVVAQTCDDNTLSQRWAVDFAQEQTTIASEKNRDQALQGNGIDTAVTPNEATGAFAPNQTWTPYDK
jgi:hypothetical protein